MRLSSEMIIRYYSLRWSIEAFFKFAKQNLSLSKCQIRSEQAQKHDMILVSIAYLIFNDLMEMIQTNQKNVPHHKILYAIRVAVWVIVKCFGISKTGRILHKSIRRRLFPFECHCGTASLPAQTQSLWILAVYAILFLPAGKTWTSSQAFFQLLKLDSIGFVVLMCWKCAAGKS